MEAGSCAMSGKVDSNKLVIMTADIAGSTALYAQIGDVQALVADCLTAIKALCVNTFRYQRVRIWRWHIFSGLLVQP